MLTSFKRFVEKNNLFDTSQKIILAVSGGVDSMVLAYLFHKAGFSFDMAHCNFSLRGKEADMDEALVRTTAEQYKVSFYCKKFNTKKFAKENKMSIQMAARELRYNWFNELHQNNLCDYIALAHHQNDIAETFLINLMRGTGISGLHGIRAKTSIFIRPLLFVDKKQIEAFAKINGIAFRNDKSNADDKYIRNKLRNKIIPLLETINPSAVSSLCDTAAHLSEVERLYRHHIEKQKNKILEKKGSLSVININQLKKTEAQSTLLYEILSQYTFNTSQIRDILNAVDGISGKVFYSPTHKLLKDREALIIEELQQNENDTLLIGESNEYIKTDSIALYIINFIKPDNFNPFTASDNTVFLDFNKVKFPLTLRKWENGDYFIPLGMKKKKKISDFLIDNKINRFEKENVKILCADEKVVWIVGMRADERYKITPQTKRVLKIQIL